MSERKKRTKALRLKKIIQAADPIMRVDSQTYYHRRTDPVAEPYMVFNSQSKGWMCDCMAFVMNMTGSGKVEEYQCKHIKAIIEKYSL